MGGRSKIRRGGASGAGGGEERSKIRRGGAWGAELTLSAGASPRRADDRPRARIDMVNEANEGREERAK